MTPVEHVVRRLWIRPVEGGEVVEVASLDLVAGKGVTGDHSFGRLRHVTIVFEDDWNRAATALGREVDPAGRRANVLVTGGGGGRFIGSCVCVGDARIDVKGETAPCPVMEHAAPGMQRALKPESRAGIWGRVAAGGVLRPGDRLVEEGTA